MVSKKRSKLSIVGAGAVGSSLAYAALIRGSAREIVLYDLDEKTVAAEVADLQHGTQFTPTNKVSGGSDEEAPTVEFESPLDTSAAAAKTVASCVKRAMLGSLSGKRVTKTSASACPAK